jgi:hypothetical protein
VESEGHAHEGSGRGYGIEHVPALRRGARRGRPRVLLSAQAVAPPPAAGRSLNISYLGSVGAAARDCAPRRPLPLLGTSAPSSHPPALAVLSGIRGTPPETPGKEGDALSALSHGPISEREARVHFEFYAVSREWRAGNWRIILSKDWHVVEQEGDHAVEWEDVLLAGVERKDLDYKGPAEWNEQDKKACCEIVKDVLAMANTNGGFIVIGVAEGDTGFDWTGLSPDDLKTWETSRLNRFIQNYADPPINATLHKKRYEGKDFVFVQIPAFIDVPHICQKDYPGVLSTTAIYVRTDNNESAPLRCASDSRVIVDRAVRNRSDKLLESVRAIMTGSVLEPRPEDVTLFQEQIEEALISGAQHNPYSDKGYAGYYRSAIRPRTFQKGRFSLPVLQDAAEKASINYIGWPFLYIRPSNTYAIQDGIETAISFIDFRNDDAYDFWQLRDSGMFFHQSLMREEAEARRRGWEAFAAVWETKAYVAQAIDCLGRLYTLLGFEGEDMTLDIWMEGTDNRLLLETDPQKSGLFRDYRCRIPSINVRRTARLEEWRAARIDLAVELVAEVFHRFNWSTPPTDSFRCDIEKLFQRRL